MYVADCMHFRNPATCEPIIRAKLDKLFEIIAVLYDAGARNFLLFDVMPVYRTPAVSELHILFLQPISCFDLTHPY